MFNGNTDLTTLEELSNLPPFHPFQNHNALPILISIHYTNTKCVNYVTFVAIL